MALFGFLLRKIPKEDENICVQEIPAVHKTSVLTLNNFGLTTK